MAKTIQELEAEIDAQLPDNVIGLITPNALRGVLKDIVDNIGGSNNTILAAGGSIGNSIVTGSSASFFSGVGMAVGNSTVAASGSPTWIGPTWSPTDHSEFITISGTNNEIATRNSVLGGSYASGLSDTWQTTGIRYVEIVTTQLNAAAMVLGVGNGAAELGQFAGFDNNSIGYYSPGGVLLNSAFTGTAVPSFGTGDIIGMNIDLNGNTIQFNKNGGAMSIATSIAALRPSSDPIFVMYSIQDTLNDAASLRNI